MTRTRALPILLAGLVTAATCASALAMTQDTLQRKLLAKLRQHPPAGVTFTVLPTCPVTGSGASLPTGATLRCEATARSNGNQVTYIVRVKVTGPSSFTYRIISARAVG